MVNRLKTLTSLAILKADIDDDRRDYLDYLLAFVIHVLNIHKPDPVTDKIISQLLLETFGLNVPYRGCQLVLRRLARKGYLKKEHNVYIVDVKLPKIDFSQKREIAERKIEAVYSKLIEFSKKHYSQEWSLDQATSALVGFLDQFGIEFLRAYVFKTALPEVPESGPRVYYIVSRFISKLHDDGDPVFECVSVLVKGQMYANALVCPDLESLEKKFDNLTFYVDTPLVLNYFGLQGDEERAATQELFQLIQRLRGKVSVFEHTIDEAKRVISAAEDNVDDLHAKGQVIREIRKSGRKRSDLILLNENIRERLENDNISIARTPQYKQEYQLSESELEDAVKNLITYRNPQALLYDINSIRSIYVLRAGRTPRRLEDSHAVFVTPNSPLASAAFQVGRNHNSTREVSSVITDYSLANVAWLKAPLGAPELPEKELMAACYAAMEPGAALWERYLEEIQQLKNNNQISVDDHALLRVSPLASSELMSLTMGDEQALTGTNIRQILDRVKADLVRDKDAALEQERAAKERVIVERDHLRENNDTVNKNIYWLCGRLAYGCSRVLKYLILLLLVSAGVSAPFITSPFILNSMPLTAAVVAVFLIGIVWGLMSWYFGISVKEVVERTEAGIHKFLIHVLNNLVLNKGK